MGKKKRTKTTIKPASEARSPGTKRPETSVKAESTTVAAQTRPAWLWVIPTLFLVVFLCYWNSLHGEFQFDDSRLIRFNFHLRDLSNWHEIFRSEMFRPLLAWSFALNYRLTGNDPFSYHLFNVLFHAIAVCLFYFFVSRQTNSRWLPVTSAILMAVHPLNTESVSYIASRSTVLCSIFYFAALLSLDSHLRSPRRFVAALYVLLFLVGATVKEEAAMIPIMGLLYQYFFFGRDTIRRHRGLNLTIGALLAAGGVFRVAMQIKQGGALPYTFDAWIPTQVIVWIRYLGLAFVPISLNVDPDIPASGLSALSFWGAALMIGLLCTAAWRWRKEMPFLAFWILWYFLNLLPSSVFPLQDFMAEHRAYISSFAFAAFAGWFLIDFCAPRIKSAAALTVIVFLLASSYCFATIQRNKVWATNILLWTDSVHKSPQKGRTHLNLAASYLKHLDYDAAIQEYQAAAALDPDSPLAYSGLGICYLKGKGDLDNAETNFKKALQIQPDLTDAKTGLGTIYYRQQKYAMAIQILDPIYQFRQESVEIVAMASECYLHLKNYDRAIFFLKRGIELDPETPGWYYHLMEAYFLSNRFEDSGRVYDQYSQIFVRSPRTRLSVAMMLVGGGRVQEGVKLLQELTTDPTYGPIAAEQLRALKK